MRRSLAAALAVLLAAALAGCGSDDKTVAPKQEIELPKEGPAPAGAGKGKAAAPGPNQSAD
jgi:hypothetical protein